LLQGFHSNADGNDSYDTTKIPDLWDMTSFDLLRHRSTFHPNEICLLEELIETVEPLYTWVSVCEFGIEPSEKINIGCDVSWRIAGKVLADLQFMVNDIDEAGRQNRKTPLSAAPGGGSGSTIPDESLPELNPLGASPAMSRTQSGRGALGPVSEEEEEEVERAKVALTELEQRGKSIDDMSAASVADKRGSVDIPEKGEDGDSSAGRASVKQLPTRKNLAENLRNSSNPNHLHDSMKDGSDWHPRRPTADLSAETISGYDRGGIVRSRIYSTSASTMHTLYNILLHGDSVCETKVLDQSQKASLDFVSDLGYLSHFVIRCYEPPPNEDGPVADDLAAYRVEVCVSPGIFFPPPDEIDEARSPTPVDAFKIRGKNISKSNATLAPLYVMSANINLKDLDSFITTIIKETTKEESERGDDVEEEEEDK